MGVYGLLTSHPTHKSTASRTALTTPPTYMPQASVDPAQSFREAGAKEALFQLREFMGDFSGHDVARLLCGLSDLHAPVGSELHGVVMKVRAV